MDERNLKTKNLTYFSPNVRGTVENKNNPANIRFVDKTSDIRN